MEEPESEPEPEPEPLYEIQEYSSSKVSHENSMMKWMLNKGYGIGKKVAIIGVAISAAPLVLPPIVVFSAMGVAFSIPSGFVFASYACTNKLMTTLLPIPPSPLILEYYTDEDENEKATNEGVESSYISNGYRQMDELEKGYYLNEYDDELYPENVMQEENEEGSRVLDSEVEALVTHTGWDLNEYEEEKHGDRGLLQMETVDENEERGKMEDTEQDVEMSHRLDARSNTNFGGGVDEQGYEEDVGEYLEGDDDSLEEERKREESLLENRIDENENIILVVTEDDKEEIVEESTGLLDKVMDEGRADDDTTEHDYLLDGSVSDVAYEADKEVETPVPVTVNEGSVEDDTNKDGYFLDGSASNGVSKEIKNKETAEPVSVNERSVENNTVEDDNFLDESVSNVVLQQVEDDETTEPVIVKEIETQKLVKDGSKNDEPIGEMHRVVILSPGDEGNNFNSREVEELDLVAREAVGDVDQDTGNIDSDEKVMRESMGTQEKTGSDIRDEGREDSSLGTRKDHSVNANVGAIKVDEETGLVLFDDQNTSVNFKALEAGGESKENVGKNLDVLELPAFRRVPLDTDNAQVTSKTNTKTPSREDALNDKMIWKKIGEKRAIEHIGEESLLKSKLDEKKGKEPLLESKLSDDKSKTQEVTNDRLENIVKGSTGLLEKIRDKGTVNENTLEHDQFSVPNVLFEGTKEAEKTEPVTVAGIEIQILVKDESKNNETIRETHHAVLLSGSEQNNFKREVEESDLGSIEVVQDFDEVGRNIDYDEKVMRTGGGIYDQGTEDASLGTEKDHMIHANADAREMGDERGLDLFDDQKTSMKFESIKGGGASKEIVVDQNVDEQALTAFRQVSLDTDDGNVTSKMKAKSPSKEGVLDDEKIWEKIVAMRTIVGYNAPSQPTCMGELKALYVFTGVEPPASFESNTDLDEVNGRLKFLMAIVGVK